MAVGIADKVAKRVPQTLQGRSRQLFAAEKQATGVRLAHCQNNSSSSRVLSKLRKQKSRRRRAFSVVSRHLRYKMPVILTGYGPQLINMTDKSPKSRPLCRHGTALHASCQSYNCVAIRTFTKCQVAKCLVFLHIDI